jgi:hypothetical protein
MEETRKRVALSLTEKEYEGLVFVAEATGMKVTTAAHLALIQGLPIVLTDAQKHQMALQVARNSVVPGGELASKKKKRR